MKSKRLKRLIVRKINDDHAVLGRFFSPLSDGHVLSARKSPPSPPPPPLESYDSSYFSVNDGCDAGEIVLLMRFSDLNDGHGLGEFHR